MGSPTTSEISDGGATDGGRPLLWGDQSRRDEWLLRLFLVAPFVALVVAVPFAWGWGLTPLDVGLTAGFYCISGLGVTAGFHRCFTHRSFKARRGLHIGLAVAGTLAFQGPVINWVADHRRHHAFADREGDPHSPWLFGTSPAALARGFLHAHTGWMLGRRSGTNLQRFAPDLLADPDLRRIEKLFLPLSLIGLLAPALVGGLVTLSWWGALTALFWAGLVRIGLLQHVTFSINSICHLVGSRPCATRDRSTNVWPLALVSFGESWHNFHHADPTCARHGVGRGRLDATARLIWVLERFGWAYDVRWPGGPGRDDGPRHGVFTGPFRRRGEAQELLRARAGGWKRGDLGDQGRTPSASGPVRRRPR